MVTVFVTTIVVVYYFWNKKGLGFGFLKCPFVVSGSLNGYMLETDPVVPSHTPVFDAELVWEADKRRFRSLRVQNVPAKIEVYTTGSQGRKDKVGYLLLSLLGAQPRPSNKIVDIKQTWHKLLGVRSEGKCCQPQLLMSLTIEDRSSTPTPRNELRIFHNNEVAHPSARSNKSGPPPATRSMLLTLSEYLTESKKTVSSFDLRPKLICEEGLIQIGSGNHLFVLGLVISAVDNLELLLAPNARDKDITCYVTYSVFTHNVLTDRVNAISTASGCIAQINQRTSLRLRTDLSTLSRYFSECPHLVTRVCAGDVDVGICSLDLRKLVPTDDVKKFLNNFCNEENSLTIQERCFILRCDDVLVREDGRRPFMDVELSLKYVGVRNTLEKPALLTARSATQLESGRSKSGIEKERILDFRSGSCTNLDKDVGGVAYTNMAPSNTARYKNASGDAVLQTNEITELIKKMCDSFAQSQERLLAARPKTTSDQQVQCEPSPDTIHETTFDNEGTNDEGTKRQPLNLQTCQSDPCIKSAEKVDVVHTALPHLDREALMQKYVDELEDWKERQQQLFKIQLKRKEDYHLDQLANEWSKRRIDLESKLSKGIEQCRNLAADLSRATDDFRLRGYRNTERERKLLEAKKALEAHYTAKYHELREASQKMEDDMNHRLKLKDMAIEEIQQTVQSLEKQNDVLKNNLNNIEKDAGSKYSGLTKDQTASLIQELRCLEEKLDSAVQSKAFFKEQWGRAVRELHVTKLSARTRMLAELRERRRRLGDSVLDPIDDMAEGTDQNPADINKLKDDFYVDMITKSPPETNSIINNDAMDLYEVLKIPKQSTNDKLSELILQRDQLIQQDAPNEDILKQLNHEIRNMLLTCGN